MELFGEDEDYGITDMVPTRSSVILMPFSL